MIIKVETRNDGTKGGIGRDNVLWSPDAVSVVRAIRTTQ